MCIASHTTFTPCFGAANFICDCLAAPLCGKPVALHNGPRYSGMGEKTICPSNKHCRYFCKAQQTKVSYPSNGFSFITKGRLTYCRTRTSDTESNRKLHSSSCLASADSRSTRTFFSRHLACHNISYRTACNQSCSPRVDIALAANSGIYA